MAVGPAAVQAGRLLWNQGLGSRCREPRLTCAQGGSAERGRGGHGPALLPALSTLAPQPSPALSCPP